MCACRQKKSFFIEDILKDVSGKNKVYKNISQEPTQPLHCNRGVKQNDTTDDTVVKDIETTLVDDKITKFNVICEVQQELALSKVNLVQRRNTFPLYPTPVKANVPWSSYRIEAGHPYCGSYCSEPILNSAQMIRTQLASNRFIPHTSTIQAPYGYPRVPMAYWDTWIDMRGRRKGRQVRFSATQTVTLERRFSLTKYLRPDERRDLALSLKLSDRQVKTWFQNRRAKWRRCTPEAADTGSHTEDEGSDYEVQIAADQD